MYSYVDVTSYVVLLNLPADVVNILPWSSPAAVTRIPFGPTGAMPADFWQKIGAAASAIVNSLVQLGQMFYDGLVALGTFLVNLAEAIVDWGMKVLGAIWEKVVAVAQAAVAVLNQALDWILSWIVSQVRALMDYLLEPLFDALSGWALHLNDIFARIAGVGDTDALDARMLFDAAFSPDIVNLAEGLSLAVQVAIGIIVAVTVILPGAAAVGSAIKGVVSKILKNAVEHRLGLSIALGAGLILGAIVPALDPIWSERTGIGTGFSAILVVVLQELIAKYASTLGEFQKFLTGDYIGLFLSLVGFFLTLAVALNWGAVRSHAHEINVLGAIISGIGLIVALGTDSWNDNLPGPWGFLDEGIAAASFGYAAVQAFTS